MANPFETSATQLGQASDIFTQAAGAAGQGTQNADAYAGMLGGSINEFLNPYYDEVINATLGRIEDTRRVQSQQVGDQAAAAAAFGGARHALETAKINEEAMRQSGEVASNLYGQGFNTALSGALSSNQQRLGALGQMMGAGGALSGLAGQNFNIGQQLQQAQMGQGSMQQALLQQILSGAEGQYGATINSPLDAINLVNAVLSGDPRQAATTSSQTQTSKPGMLDYLGLGLQVGGRILAAPATGGSSVAAGKKGV